MVDRGADRADRLIVINRTIAIPADAPRTDRKTRNLDTGILKTYVAYQDSNPQVLPYLTAYPHPGAPSPRICTEIR